MSKDIEPVLEQWYRNSQTSEKLRVVQIEATAVTIEYDSGVVEDISRRKWAECDLEEIPTRRAAQEISRKKHTGAETKGGTVAAAAVPHRLARVEHARAQPSYASRYRTTDFS